MLEESRQPSLEERDRHSDLRPAFKLVPKQSKEEVSCKEELGAELGKAAIRLPQGHSFRMGQELWGPDASVQQILPPSGLSDSSKYHSSLNTKAQSHFQNTAEALCFSGVFTC